MTRTIKPYSCKNCDKDFTTKGALTRHNKEVHKLGKIYQCPNCPKSFVRKYRFNTHIKSCQNEENHCGKIYRSPKCSKDMKENLYENDFLSNLIKAANGNRQKKKHVYLEENSFSRLIIVVEYFRRNLKQF